METRRAQGRRVEQECRTLTIRPFGPGNLAASSAAHRQIDADGQHLLTLAGADGRLRWYPAARRRGQSPSGDRHDVDRGGLSAARTTLAPELDLSSRRHPHRGGGVEGLAGVRRPSRGAARRCRLWP